MSIHHAVFWTPKALAYLFLAIWVSGFIIGVKVS